MGDLLVDNETTPSTPASSKSVLYVDSTTKKQAQLDDAGHVYGILSRNHYTGASFTSAAADTYLTNSGLLIPSCGLQVGQLYEWRVHASKTAAGTTAAVMTLRCGSAQTTSDTSITAQTQVTAQAAVLNDGELIIQAYVTTIGASAIMAVSWGTTGNTTGFGSGKSAQSATFNSTTVAPAGNYMGVSFNANTAATWTFTGVWAQLTG